MKFSNIITIGDKAIGPDCPAFIVAEAGVAHYKIVLYVAGLSQITCMVMVIRQKR